MDRKELEQTVREMIAAASCCEDLRIAGRRWLDAMGTDDEPAAAKALQQEIREDIAPIEHVIEFFESPSGKQIFGEEKAKAMAAHAREVQARGGKWCDCPACSAGLKILESGMLAV